MRKKKAQQAKSNARDLRSTCPMPVSNGLRRASSHRHSSRSRYREVRWGGKSLVGELVSLPMKSSSIREREPPASRNKPAGRDNMAGGVVGNFFS